MANTSLPQEALDEIKAKQRALAELCNERSYPITRFIQPIGLLFVVDKNFVVQKVSENVGVLGQTAEQILDSDLLSLIAPTHAATFQESAAYLFDDKTDVVSARLFLEWVWHTTLPLAEHRAEGFVYRSGDFLCIEAELPYTVPLIAGRCALESRAMNEIALFRGGLEEFAALLTEWMRKIIGFDRVYCFKFDAQKNGVVVGESRNEKFPSLKDHHFPATDIPTNLHEIYKRSRFRYLADRDCQLVGLIESSGASEPLDLSLSLIRQISPSHLQYLANMNVEATISFSIVIDGHLWGLLGGHHAAPRHLPFRTLVEAQQVVELFASRLQVITEISDKRRLEQHLDYILDLARHYERVSCDFGAFVSQHVSQLRGLVGSDDLLWTDGASSIGTGGLSEQNTAALIAFVKERIKQQSVFGTESLVSLNPSFAALGDVVAGVLALAVDEQAILIWIRKEQIQQRKWGGNPYEVLRLDTDGKVGPRHSFSTWVQQVRYTAHPWESADFRALEQLRLALIGVKASHANHLLTQNRLLQTEIEERKQIEWELLSTSESLRKTNKQLESFAYVASHDLQEPLRMVASYSQLLEKRYGHQLEGEARQYLTYAVDGAKRMRALIDAILSYSRLSSEAQAHEAVALSDILAEVREALADSIKETGTTIEADKLPIVLAEKTQVYQLFQNLIGNAIKFCKEGKSVHIQISASREDKFWRIAVQDNGIGIPADMQRKVFELFQRLNPHQYSGTGIGLATCQRIVELHGGRIWCESSEQEGSAFFFTLPTWDEEIS